MKRGIIGPQAIVLGVLGMVLAGCAETTSEAPVPAKEPADRQASTGKGVPATSPSSVRGDPQARGAACEKALRLVGRVAGLQIKEPPSQGDIASAESIGRSMKLMDAVAKVRFAGADVPSALAQAARLTREVTHGCSLVAQVQGDLDEVRLKEIMGQENATERSEWKDEWGTKPMTWLKYGWVAFGVVEGQVGAVMIKADEVPPAWPASLPPEAKQRGDALKGEPAKPDKIEDDPTEQHPVKR